MRPLHLLSLLALGSTVFAQAPADAPSAATPAEALTVAPGFKVELLKSAAKEEGSWVCMAVDAKGRLYISAQGKPPGADFKKDSTWGGLFRVTLDAAGHIAQWEKVNLPVGDAMGMLWAFDSLYVSGDGPQGRGIYRLKDSNGDDQLDSAVLFHQVKGGNGEHGAHAIVLGPDGKSLFIVHGNSTPLIEGVDAATSPYRNYAEDDVLPRVMDPVATFFDKIHSPYGYVLKTDENGSKWELYAGGFRNPYDIAFNPDGELFTYDSDMEWDVAMPWYRPTRVLHIVPGGEYGFREGSAKWPAYYPDSLPAAVNIGLGCPTGVTFGTKSNFPAKYKSAFFILDWTFGRILAVHLHEKGSTYTAENPGSDSLHLTGPLKSDDVEEFVKGKGLPVTDVEFGKDGAMYFTIGGRGTQAGLYRVSWTDSDTSAPTRTDRQTELNASAKWEGGRIRPPEAKSRMRRSAFDLGTFDTPSAKTGWALIDCGDDDRWIRFAARKALEASDVSLWRADALTEGNALRAHTALLAFARVGTKDDQEPLLKALARFPLESLSDELKLDQLRVIQVSLARQGRPSTDQVNALIARLSPLYPAKSFPLNRELCTLLVALGAPEAIDKTLTLMSQAKEPAEAVWYATCLREATGWTPAQRQSYFGWFATVRNYQGGNSAKKFILRIRDQALEKVPAEERPALLALAEKEVAAPKPAQPMPMRPFVKAWTVADLVPALDQVAKGRDFAKGQKLYGELLCAQCHLFAGRGGEAKGGAVGPDLTAVGSRFARKDILEAIIEPSKAISEQYASFLFTMNDGSMVGGQIAEENHYLLTLITDPISGTKVNYPKGKVVKREMSTVSLMPPGLLYSCTQEDILDLLAYLESAGNAEAANFKK